MAADAPVYSACSVSIGGDDNRYGRSLGRYNNELNDASFTMADASTRSLRSTLLPLASDKGEKPNALTGWACVCLRRVAEATPKWVAHRTHMAQYHLGDRIFSFGGQDGRCRWSGSLVGWCRRVVGWIVTTGEKNDYKDLVMVRFRPIPRTRGSV
jgi:hypothetical protein